MSKLSISLILMRKDRIHTRIREVYNRDKKNKLEI